jgi:hypothetical protein
MLADARALGGTAVREVKFRNRWAWSGREPLCNWGLFPPFALHTEAQGMAVKWGGSLLARCALPATPEVSDFWSAIIGGLSAGCEKSRRGLPGGSPRRGSTLAARTRSVVRQAGQYGSRTRRLRACADPEG